jgi:hypothetical protein
MYFNWAYFPEQKKHYEDLVTEIKNDGCHTHSERLGHSYYFHPEAPTLYGIKEPSKISGLIVGACYEFPPEFNVNFWHYDTDPKLCDCSNGAFVKYCFDENGNQIISNTGGVKETPCD